MTQTKDTKETIRIGAVQAESAWLDLQAGVDKTCAIIKEAGEKGVEILGFPEVFIPGFPFQIYTSTPDQDFVLDYQKNSMVVGSPEYNQIRRAVRDAGIWAVVGFSERVGSTLYLAQSFNNPKGDVVHHRRKLKPTHVERYLYGDDTKTCVTTEKDITIGGLNCWEHFQPLLKYHHYNQGVQVHVASWPYLAPTGPGVPMSTSAEVSGDVITRTLAVEGGCFAMVCSATNSKEGSIKMKVPTTLGGPTATPIEGGGFAAIYSPNGTILAKSKDQSSEEIVIADVDLDDIHRHEQRQIVSGINELIFHVTRQCTTVKANDSYTGSRPDLFSLNVTNTAMPRVKYSDGSHIPSVAARQLPLED
ncbi:nitrilase [Kwoniella mangroviensis CBS 8886]|nr:nitrilase [Kwoniella mangroviensis CBS 8886]